MNDTDKHVRVLEEFLSEGGLYLANERAAFIAAIAAMKGQDARAAVEAAQTKDEAISDRSWDIVARRGGKVPLSHRIRPEREAAPWVVEEVRKLEAELAAAVAAVAAVEASGKVSELTERQRKVVDFALSRFIQEAYWRANEAAQKSTAVYFAPGALERLLGDAKDAEAALAALSQGGKP